MISRKMIISIESWVLKASDSNTLSKFDDHINLRDDWARGILQSMEWIKRKGSTRRIEPSPNY